MEAFFRLACWNRGALNLEWRNFRRRDVLSRPPNELVTSGLSRLDEWTDLLGRLASPNTVFRVDLDALIDRLSSTFGQLTEVLNACDGVRSVVQIVDACGISGLDVLKSLIQLRDEGLISAPGQPAAPDRVRADLEATLMGGGGAPHLHVAAPLAPRPRPTSALTRRDSPAQGAPRLTAALGQAGLPVSVAEAKKLPAVTMQFPSRLPIPGREIDSSEGPGPLGAAQGEPVRAQSAEPSQTEAAQVSVSPGSTPQRLTMPRPLPPRLRPTPPQPLPIPPTAAQPQEAESQPTEPASLEKPREAPGQPLQPSDAQGRPQPPSPSPLALTLAGLHPMKGLPNAEVPNAAPRPAAPADPEVDERRPWWDRRNEKRPAPNEVGSDGAWNPVWPQPSQSPPEPTAPPPPADRESPVKPGESPTVYLPARPGEARPAPARPAPVRPAAPSRRAAPYAEGIRPRQNDKKRRDRGAHKKIPWWQRHRVLLLAVGTSVLLGALVAIGVAVMRSLTR